MAKKKNKQTLWIILILGIIAVVGVLFYGGNQGWFKFISQTAFINQYDSSDQNYFCCSYNNQYSCSLNSCSFGSKVYTGSFNTLDSCNAKCQTPQTIQPPLQAQTQTCQQIASGLSASYKNTPVSNAKECMDFAVLDCQDTGKILDGYGISGTCCYYTCVAIAQPACTDSDGGQDDQQFIKGVVNTINSIYADECNWGTGRVTEYYCDNGIAKQTNIMCENYWTCQDGKCAQQLCEDITSPSIAKCASGYTTDGGTCAYWNINGGQCISSF